MKRLIYSLFLVSCLVVTLFGCSERGCTDPLASNYDPEATKNDGSCDYTGLVHFWIDSTSSQSLQQVSNDDLIYVYVDEDLMNAIDITNYLTDVPVCGSGWMTKRISVGKNSSKTVTFRISHLSSSSGEYETFQEGTMLVVHNGCTQQQVIF